MLLYSLFRILQLFVLDYRGEWQEGNHLWSTTTLFQTELSSFSPQTWLGLRAYCHEMTFETEIKKGCRLLCTVVWLLLHSGSFFTCFQSLSETFMPSVWEQGELCGPVPPFTIPLIPEQLSFPRNCRVWMQKPSSPRHHIVLVELAPTVAILNALMGLGCRAQIFLLMTNIYLYNCKCTDDDGGQLSKHRCHPYCSRGQNIKWSKLEKWHWTGADWLWTPWLLLRNRSHQVDPTDFNGDNHKARSLIESGLYYVL